MSVPACVCGAEAVVLFPGDAGSDATLWNMGRVKMIDTFVLRRPVDGWGLCMAHARERGWPNYPSEKTRKTACPKP